MARAIPVLLTVAALAFGLGTGPAAAAGCFHLAERAGRDLGNRTGSGE